MPCAAIGQSVVSWDRTLGGSGFEELKDALEAPDGNYLFFGAHTSPISGEVSEASRGYSDYWLVKLAPDGSKIWDHRYGGDLIELGQAFQSTSDGGFILAGHSSSGANGEKSEASSGACFDCFDYWIAKVDANGIFQWDNTFNANNRDELYSIINTPDGGYLLGGFSNSDISGDKSEASRGNYDYWIIKTDAAGNLQWDRTYGGSGDDFLYEVANTPDGNYLLMGSSASDVSGEKNSLSRGGHDYWILKIDPSGAIIWQQTVGGPDNDNAYAIHVNPDGTFLAGGTSFSDIGGEKNDPLEGDRDYWIVKMDADGNILWEESLGGLGREQLYDINKTQNGTYLITGLSRSDISGDKTFPNQGVSDYWLLAVDEMGNIVKELALGGDGNDNLHACVPLSDGSMLLGGFTASGASGDKSEPSRGFNDNWVVKVDCAMPLDLGPDTIICAGEPIGFDLTVPGCTCCEYQWSDGYDQAQRTWVPNGSEAYSVTISDAWHCRAVDSIRIDIQNPPVFNLGPDQTICDGEVLTLASNISGVTYNWSTAATSPNINATTAGTYSLTVTDNANCSYTDDVNLSVNPVFQSTVIATICEGDSIWLSNAFQQSTGVYSDTLTSTLLCDSIISTNLTVFTQDTIWLSAASCAPSDTGVFISTFTNQNGCDSLIIETVDLLVPDTTLFFETSCNPAQIGVNINTLSNQIGCDSLIITQTDFDPLGVDSTFISQIDCDQNQAGLVIQTLNNQAGCDSLIFTTTNYSPPDTTFLFNTSCDPAQIGININTLSNQIGCDSLIITQTDFDPLGVDSTFISQIDCDQNQAGLVIQTLNNQAGCDSLIFTTTNYSPPDTTLLFNTSCDPAQIGININTLSNQIGCDSLIITQTDFDPLGIDSTFIDQLTCDQSQAGLTVQTLSNQAGCDSLIFTTANYSPPDTTFLFESSCDISLVGIEVEVQSNEVGCDSLIILETLFDPSGIDSTFIDLTTCDPSQSGSSVQIWTNQAGCDSLVFEETILLSADTIYMDSLNCDASTWGTFVFEYINAVGCDSLHILTIEAADLVAELNITDETCAEEADGQISIENVIGGSSPYLYAIDEAPYQAFPGFARLAPGDYRIRVQDANGCEWAEEVSILAAPLLSVDLGQDTMIHLGSSIQLQASINQFIDSLTWDSEAELSCMDCLNPASEPQISQAYTLSVMNEQGCRASDQIWVRVDRGTRAFVPNIFTPNNDLMNDLVRPLVGSEVSQIESFSIFSRWGELVYEARDMDPTEENWGWDGSLNGQALQPAVFVYRLDLLLKDGRSESVFGDITLLR
ncbi:MAG: T9SS type B sorting domain-containing protein [Bacteroidota bacterium]